MAVTLKSALIQVDWSSVLRNALDLETPESALKRAVSASFTDGAGDNQANLHWSDQRSVGGSTFETLNLTALADGPYGTVNFADIRAILFHGYEALAGWELGGAAADAWEQWVKTAGDIRNVKKGGVDLWVAPYDAGGVVDGTHKNIKVANLHTSAQLYRILILGSQT
jgi:hypothetical protein